MNRGFDPNPDPTGFGRRDLRGLGARVSVLGPTFRLPKEEGIHDTHPPRTLGRMGHEDESGVGSSREVETPPPSVDSSDGEGPTPACHGGVRSGVLTGVPCTRPPSPMDTPDYRRGVEEAGSYRVGVGVTKFSK